HRRDVRLDGGRLKHLRCGRLGLPQMPESEVSVPANHYQQHGDADMQSSFSHHYYCSPLPQLFSAPSAVIRVARQRPSAAWMAARLWFNAPSADITELAARVKRRASSCRSK